MEKIEPQNLQFIKIASDLGEMIRQAAVQRVGEINYDGKDIGYKAAERYNDIQDLIKEYIKTIPEHHRKSVYEFFEKRTKACTEIVNQKDFTKQKELASGLGIDIALVKQKRPIATGKRNKVRIFARAQSTS